MRTPIEYYVVDFERTPTAEALNEIGKEGWRLVAIRDIYTTATVMLARCIFSRRKHTVPTE